VKRLGWSKGVGSWRLEVRCWKLEFEKTEVIINSNLRSIMIKSYKDLNVYNLSYELAIEIFWLTRDFSKEKRYSLTSQIVRSSRSISSNITEGWAKREYENYFKQHLIHAHGSNVETENWLRFAKDCNYITDPEADRLNTKLEQIGKMLTKLHQNWKFY
jgi:four helix bundle protein